MASVGTVYMDVMYNTGKISKDLTRAVNPGAAAAAGAMAATFDQKLSTIGASAERVGKRMSIGLTLPLVGIGAAAVKGFFGFERSMTKVESLVGASSDQVKAYSEDVRRIGVEFGIGAQAAADALYFITSAGYEGAAAIDVLETSAKASAVGLGQVPVIADLLTSAINAYGSANLDAAQAADILTAAVRSGKAEPEELAGSMGRVLPIASALGVGLDEVAGAFAALSKTGTKADEAATQIRAILVALLKPSSGAKDALREVGIAGAEAGQEFEFLREQLGEQGLLPVLKLLTDALGDDAAATAAVFENVRALSGVMDILGANLSDTERIMAEVSAATGDMDDAFRVTAESSAFKFDQAMSALKEALIDVGASLAPVITSIASGAAAIASVFGELPGPVKTVVVGFGSLLAVAGPLTFAVGKLIKAFLAMKATVVFFSGPTVAQGIAGMGTTSETAARSVGRLNGGMLGLARTMVTGAAAAGAAYLAWKLWSDAMEEAAEASRKVNDSILGGLESNSLEKTEAQIAEIRNQVAGIDEDLANSSNWAFWDADYRKQMTAFRNELVSTHNQMQENVYQAEQLAAATGTSADAASNWIAKQKAAGTTYSSLTEATDAYVAALAAGEVKLDDIASATKEANGALDAQRQAIQGVQSAFLGAVDGGRGLEDATKAIATAQRGAEQATRQIATAQRSYRDALKSVESAQDSYIDSLKGVESAQRDAIDAQRALDEALNGPSVDDDLSLEGARIRLEEAQRRMAEGDFEDDLDRRRAVLALRQAEVDLSRTEERIANRPAEAAAELETAQWRLVDAQKSAKDAADGVADANLGVADAAYAVQRAQYDAVVATDAIRDAEDKAARAALELTNKQAELAAVMRDDTTGAAEDLIEELLGLQSAYPQLAAAMQPYIDQLRTLQALKSAASAPGGFSGLVPDRFGPRTTPQPAVSVPDNVRIGPLGPYVPQGNGITVYGYNRAPEDIVNEIEQRQQQAVSGLGVF